MHKEAELTLTKPNHEMSLEEASEEVCFFIGRAVIWHCTCGEKRKGTSRDSICQIFNNFFTQLLNTNRVKNRSSF